MALFLNGKKLLNSLVIDGDTGDKKLWILNPDESDAMVNVTSQSQVDYMAAFIPFISKIKEDSSKGTPVMGRKQLFGGSSLACIYRTGYQVGAVIFPKLVKSGTYKKLYVNVQVTYYGTGYPRASLTLSRAMGFSSGGTPTGIIKEIILVDTSKTPAQINSQTGVAINSTDSGLLSAQVVEVDVSEINEDFYVGFWNCDRNIAIRSIYLE